MAQNMTENGLTVVDMLTLAKWAQLIHPVALDPARLSPTQFRGFFESRDCTIAQAVFPSGEWATHPITEYLQKM